MIRVSLILVGVLFANSLFVFGQVETDTTATRGATTQRKQPFEFVEQETAETVRLRKSSQRKASELVTSSHSVFMRSLLPVEGYAERMADAKQLQLTATPKDDRQARLAILKQHVERWSEAVEHLEEFRQPASGGWAADLAYARMMEAAARSEVAEELNDSDRADSLMNRRVMFAKQQFELRLADLDVGLASLTQLAEALSQVRQTMGVAATSGRGASFRSQMVEQLRRNARLLEDRVGALQERPAGISRGDALARVAYELDRVAADNDRRNAGDSNEIGRLKAAGTAAGKMLSIQHRSLSTGTAALGDLIRSWRLQRETGEAVQRIEKPGEPIRPDSRTLKELERLNVVAASIQDRRGRNAADVVYVSTLKLQEEWKSIRAQQYAAQKQAYDKR